MTTKTIPAYLEDERQKIRDAQQRIEEEAARIQLRHHGHHPTAKRVKLELPSQAIAPAETRKVFSATRVKPHTARKTAAKIRKAA